MTETRAAAAVIPEQSVSALALIRPIANPAQLLAFSEEVTQLITKSLKKGVDYGKIPGTQKETLLKPGAQRLCVAFGAQPTYTLLESEVDHDRKVEWVKRQKVWQPDKSFTWKEETGISFGLYRHIYKCRLIRPDGRILGEGDGACSTLEGKYVDRPRESENTVLKMAQKRALIAAVVQAFALSDRFTASEGDGDEDHGPELYTGTPRQLSWVNGKLREWGTPEAVWAQVHAQMKGKPADELQAVVESLS